MKALMILATTAAVSVSALKLTSTTEAKDWTVTATPANSTIEGIGFIEPISETRRLAFEVDGVVAEVLVASGEAVAEGQLLMRLHNGEQRAQVGVAEHRLQAAKANLTQLRSGAHARAIEAARHRESQTAAELEIAQRNCARLAGLFESATATSKELRDARSKAASATASHNAAKAKTGHLIEQVRGVDLAVAASAVALAEAELELAQVRLKQTYLRAPFAGKILDLVAREGERFAAGQHPAVVFGDTSRLQVRAEIDERFVHRLRTGQSAEIHGHVLGDAKFMGRVTRIEAVMGPKTVFARVSSERKDLDVLQVIIELDDAPGLPVGLRVDVTTGIDTTSKS